MVLLVGACAPSSTEGDSDSYTGPLEGKLSNNGLVLDFSVLDDLVATRLSADSQQVDESKFAPLLSTDKGAELFSYVVTCALDEDQDLRVASTGAVYTGNLGLAPQWLDGDCDTSCQRWVSACVLAHTNSFGHTVPISPRGGHENLAWNQAIEDEYSFEEAAYYGNLFMPAGERWAVVCGGQSLFNNFLVVTDGDEIDTAGAAFAEGRTSGGGTETIGFAGLCGPLELVDLPTDYGGVSACSSSEAGYQVDCLRAVEEPLEARYSEVVTVFLAP